MGGVAKSCFSNPSYPEHENDCEEWAMENQIRRTAMGNTYVEETNCKPYEQPTTPSDSTISFDRWNNFNLYARTASPIFITTPVASCSGGF